MGVGFNSSFVGYGEKSLTILLFFIISTMKYWLVNHSWESFRRTQEYCGFMSPAEQEKVKVGDGIVYFGQGLVFGVFEAIALVENEFNGWEKKYPFQVKIKPLEIPNNPVPKGIIAKSLQSKIGLAKMEGKSSNIVELSEEEFEQVKQAISEGEKEISLQ